MTLNVGGSASIIYLLGYELILRWRKFGSPEAYLSKVWKRVKDHLGAEPMQNIIVKYQ
jgi:hypothetical protein